MTARTGRMSRSSLSHNKTTGLYNVTAQFKFAKYLLVRKVVCIYKACIVCDYRLASKMT